MDREGRVFIDREPRFFGALLEFLRCGDERVFAEFQQERVEKEMEYYGIPIKTAIQKSQGNIEWDARLTPSLGRVKICNNEFQGSFFDLISKQSFDKGIHILRFLSGFSDGHAGVIDSKGNFFGYKSYGSSDSFFSGVIKIILDLNRRVMRIIGIYETEFSIDSTYNVSFFVKIHAGRSVKFLEYYQK